MHTIDTKGLSCPVPVLMTKKALEAGQLPLTVEVSDVTPLENITRFAETHGYTVSERDTDYGYELVITKA